MQRYGWVLEVERFFSKVETSEECWNWKGALNNKGYGVFRRSSGKNQYAHRFSFEIVSGKKIPKNLHIDHLCRNTKCVKPSHVEPVLPIVNVLRGNSPPALNAKKTHCIRGHPFSGKNLYIRKDTGQKCCRKCFAYRNRRQRLRKMGKEASP